MDITNISLVRFTQNGTRCTFEVDYAARFTQEELNFGFTFADTVRIREEDDSSGDDVVKDWLPAEPWKPTQKRYDWTWTIVASADDVDTELGGEEIYLQIHLRNITTMAPGLTRNTGILQVSPG